MNSTGSQVLGLAMQAKYLPGGARRWNLEEGAVHQSYTNDGFCLAIFIRDLPTRLLPRCSLLFHYVGMFDLFVL